MLKLRTSRLPGTYLLRMNANEPALQIADGSMIRAALLELNLFLKKMGLLTKMYKTKSINTTFLAHVRLSTRLPLTHIVTVAVCSALLALSRLVFSSAAAAVETLITQ